MGKEIKFSDGSYLNFKRMEYPANCDVCCEPQEAGAAALEMTDWGMGCPIPEYIICRRCLISMLELVNEQRGVKEG